MSDEDKRVYLAIDIESAGASYDHDVLAIWTCLGDFDGNVIERKSFCFFAKPFWSMEDKSTGKVPCPDGFEERCWEEFWARKDERGNRPQLDILRRIQEKATQARDELAKKRGDATVDVIVFAEHMWEQFRDYLDGLEDEYPDWNVRIVSDNPSFDLGRLDHELYARFGRLPVRYAVKNPKGAVYRWVCDPSEQLAFGDQYDEVKEIVSKICPHDHSENDAEFIYRTMIEADRRSAAYKEERLAKRQRVE
jgi:hypothetical protein